MSICDCGQFGIFSHGTLVREMKQFFLFGFGLNLAVTAVILV